MRNILSSHQICLSAHPTCTINQKTFINHQTLSLTLFKEKEVINTCEIKGILDGSIKVEHTPVPFKVARQSALGILIQQAEQVSVELPRAKWSTHAALQVIHQLLVELLG
jgi:hypothetical protein